jgi:hypothetical protein
MSIATEYNYAANIIAMFNLIFSLRKSNCNWINNSILIKRNIEKEIKTEKEKKKKKEREREREKERERERERERKREYFKYTYIIYVYNIYVVI